MAIGLSITRSFAYTILGLVAILCWAVVIGVGRSLTEKLGPLTTGASLHLTSGCLGVFFVILRSKAKDLLPISKGSFVACGILFISHVFCTYLWIDLAPSRLHVIEISLFHYLWPFLTVLISIPLLKKQAKPMLLPAIIVSFIGLLLAKTSETDMSWHSLISHISEDITPYCLAVISAITWAFFINLRQIAGNTDFRYMFLFFLMSGASLACGAVVREESPVWSLLAVGELCILLSIPLGYVLWDIGIRKGNFTVLSCASYLVPIISALFSSFYLAVIPGAKFWFGCSLVILGAVISKRSISTKVL